jgi:hypothetical protein
MSLTLAVVLVSALSLQAVGESGPQTSPSAARPDVLRIDMSRAGVQSEMPPVAFFHDRHTEALGAQSCDSCHRSKDGRPVFKFQRLTDGDYDATKDLYHGECVKCHVARKDAAKPSGPLAADCRSCHRQGEWPPENRKPPEFDRSLHARHESSTLIKPTAADDTANCSACHHVYDTAAKKTVYARGKEGSCRYCHLPEPSVQEQQPVAAFRTAAHNACVACHQNLKAKQLSAGPVNCAGCHDAAEQAKIRKLKDIPRLKRNQPDAVLLAPRTTATVETTMPPAPAPKVVAFNHLEHETNVASCRSCHHASLERCSECHTAAGDKKGGFVPLAQAMHQRTAGQSCVGCHGLAKKTASCAGCHSKMPVRRTEALDCSACHETGVGAGETLPVDDEARQALAAQMTTLRSRAVVPLTEGQVPEKVTIGVMAHQYQPAEMPHNKIVQALKHTIEESPMARHFHRQPNTLCTGCHHNSPASQNPPKCAACHGKPFRADQPDRPGLKGAYHSQCIGCHQAMGIEKPAATDCKACHAERTAESKQNANG